MPQDARSPGLATLKEAFDITYAVHRMEEEGARRRAVRGGANRGFLGGLNEEDEDSSFDEDEHLVAEAKERHAGDGRLDGRAGHVQQPQRVQPPQPSAGTGAKVAAKRAVQGSTHAKAAAGGNSTRTAQKAASRKVGVAPFELDLESATLLGRRHKRGGAGPQYGGSPLALQSPFGNSSIPENPGSPMRVD